MASHQLPIFGKACLWGWRPQVQSWPKILPVGELGTQPPSVLAWSSGQRMGKLQSMGPESVENNWADWHVTSCIKRQKKLKGLAEVPLAPPGSSLDAEGASSGNSAKFLSTHGSPAPSPLNARDCIHIRGMCEALSSDCTLFQDACRQWQVHHLSRFYLWFARGNDQSVADSQKLIQFNRKARMAFV